MKKALKLEEINLFIVSFVLHPIFSLRQRHTPAFELVHLMVCILGVVVRP